MSAEYLNKLTIRKVENGVIVTLANGMEYVLASAHDLADWMDDWYRGTFEIVTPHRPIEMTDE